MRILLALFLVMFLAILPRPVEGKVRLPFRDFLLQRPPFEVESNPNSLDGREDQPAFRSVPLVMRFLFEEAERVSKVMAHPEGGDFHSLARSILPTDIQEVGLHRLVLNFPDVGPKALEPKAEAWLVFQIHQSHILGYNCTQIVTVYENKHPHVMAVETVPLTYKNDQPLLVVNVTKSVREWGEEPLSFIVIIKDSTSYTADTHLYSFSNYIDCSLTRACDVLDLHDSRAGPVLLLLSTELSAMNVMETPGRFRRNVEEYITKGSEETSTAPPGAEFKNHCQLLEWQVNIEQLGWDWLVYPERIPLNLCVGVCPPLLDRHFNATSHAVARGLYRMVLGPEAKPENLPPCCVPVRYRRFTMLIEKTPGIISLENSSDLSAAQCGCR